MTHNKQNPYNLTAALMIAGKRIIPEYFISRQPAKYRQWHYNGCRQTAIWVNYYLTDLFPNRTILLFEATFNDEKRGDYEHAFTYMLPETREGKFFQGLFVDVSRVTYPNVVEFVDSLPELGPYWTKKSGVKTKLIGYPTPISWVNILEQEEYYTNIKYVHFCKEITKSVEELYNNTKPITHE